MEPAWLERARELCAIAQSGLTYATDQFDVQRYEAVRRIAAEMMAVGSGDERALIEGLFASETGHATPKVDVRGAVFRGDSILLVRERSDGLWALPGGWADVNETPREAVEREVLEESGYRARAVALVAAYDRSRQGHPPAPFSAYKLFFLCEDSDGPERDPDGEIEEVGFFPESALPDLSLTRVLPSQVYRLFQHHRDPSLPADFD